MNNAVHFVGFKDTNQLNNAVKVFGHPDFIHRWWDNRAVAEVFNGDIVVFAGHNVGQNVAKFTYDDSAHF